MPKRVVFLAGPRPANGYCPVPPLSNSAPERNIFRLAEFDYGEELEIYTISACGKSQAAELRIGDYISRYIQLSFPDWLYPFCQKKVFRTRFSQIILSSLFHTYDFFSLFYLPRAIRVIKKLSPDLILINSFPQYIQRIRNAFPSAKLGLFVRGEMGASHKNLPLLDGIITNSEGITSYVLGLLRGAPVPIWKIPNTLEPNFCNQRKVYSDKPKELIYVGRIQPVKGVYELLQAFRLVHAKFPSTALKIIGGNYHHQPLSEYEVLLSEYVQKHSLPVTFVGDLPNAQLPEHLMRADLAVFPSIWLESFGMVALEAMRCGLPIIASRRPGFEELVVEGETGILVDDPRNINSLAEEIVGLMDEPTLLKKLGENGYFRSLQFLPEGTNVKFKQILTEWLDSSYAE